jgi:hypothetical protein
MVGFISSPLCSCSFEIERQQFGEYLIIRPIRLPAIRLGDSLIQSAMSVFASRYK